MLPKDPFMLLSVINTELRDKYDSLESLCKAHCVDASDITEPLKGVGYVYNPEKNTFLQN